nr:spectrin beta chain, erythrocytic-like [Nerophis lumbriciformis]
MSSPCLLRAAPTVSQHGLRDVRISLKVQDTKEARRHPPVENDAPVRSRSTPPAHRALRKAPGVGRAKRREHHPERNGTIFPQVPLSLPGLVPVLSPTPSCHPLSPSSSSSSSLSAPRGVKRARWLSSSASNIYFNSILDGRFRQLQDEREAVQKKTFTKWVNSILARVSCRITDLYLDLRDGRMLIKLLEILSGERLPKPTKGRMRIHCLENVDKALQFLKEQRVHLENMGSHDIVDGNHRLILGLIWTIILRFQIQDIIVETGQADQKETRSAKDALLLWCQMKTAGYASVNITNFTTSWKDGMAFNALIHKHRPDLVDFNRLKRSNPTHNLQNAFNVAEKQLGVTKLLDPEDVFTENPDEKSIITYVVAFYHYFSKMKQLAVEGKRVGKVLDHAIATGKMVNKYETLVSNLLAWIERTILVLDNRKLANSLSGVQQQLQAFNTYRTVEKPPKFQEKGNLEVLLFTIQSRMRANNQRAYTPKEGALVGDINRAWKLLEHAEHERERVLRDELIRQEKLEQMARRFDRKAAMRETWLLENQRLVAQDNFGYDLPAVEAAQKKHDAIETDIAAYQERVQALVDISRELEAERYHDAKRVDARKDNVLRLWDYLQELLRARRSRLEKNLTLQKIFQEMLHIISWMDDMKVRLLSPDIGKHLLEVEDLLQKHALLENDISLQADRVQNASAAALKFANGENYKPCDPQVIRDRVEHLELCYQELRTLAAQRRAQLTQSRRFWSFLWEALELESWIKEKENIFSSLDYGKDLTSVLILQSKHSAFEDELAARQANLKMVLTQGSEMIRENHFSSPMIQERTENVERQWRQLEDLAAFRKQNLQDTLKFFQFQGDADELTAWLQDAKREMSSDDVGQDEYTTQRLLRRHDDLRNEATKTAATVDALSKQANGLPEELLNTPDIQRRLKDIKDLFMELMSLADVRQKKLDDAMALYTIFNETDACELWMGQKETWLVDLEVPEKLEDVEVVQNRLSMLAQDMANVQLRVDDVNNAVKQLEDSRHPRTKEVKPCQMRLNKRWDAFKALVEDKKKKIDSTVSLHNYGVDCDETAAWIRDKTRVIESTQDLGNDLAAVMTIQRKLHGLERDLAAIDSKLDLLRVDAERLATEHPQDALEILARRAELDDPWNELKNTLKDREDSLGEVSKLQKFLQDLDDFQSWLFRSQKAVASEEMPGSLPEAEEQLSLHDAVLDDIDNQEEVYRSIKDTGAKVTRGQEDDPQYRELELTLDGLDQGWYELQTMWDRRKNFLDQGLGFQQFLRDSKAVEAILNNQEYTLAHIDQPDTLAGAEKALKKHEDFLTTMEANEDKIDGTLKAGRQLVDANNLYAGKVQDKMDSISDRCNKNKARAQEVSEKLRDNRDLQHFLQNTQDLTVWINEKMLTAQDTSYDEARNLHSKWLKHQAFMAELASNKDWLDKVDQEGHELITSKPEFEPVVRERLADLHQLWAMLESTTQEKARLLFDANRSELFDQSLADIRKWLGELQQQLQSTTGDDGGGEDVRDLTNANIQLKKHQIMENQVRDRARELEELQEALRTHGGGDVSGRDDQQQSGQPDLEVEQQSLQAQFQQLSAPLAQRREKLEAARAVHQFYRDLADELLWIEERMPLALSQDHGNDLQTVQMLLKRNQTLQREIEGHQPRVDEVLERGHRMAAAAGAPEAGRLAEQLRALEEAWPQLRDQMTQRKERLASWHAVQQFYNDADEAQAWIGEQELYMIAEEKPKDEQGAMLSLKRHNIVKQAVDDYADSIRNLSERARDMLAADHPDSENIMRRQAQTDKQYAGLSDLAEDRRMKLDHMYHHFLLVREVDELEHWISERDVAASSQEVGQDLDHVTLLRDKFREFARDTGAQGQERVDALNRTIDELIQAGHSESVAMAEWKDAINEIWADLLELIDTRAQLLNASYELLKYFEDSKELVVQIHEKQKELPQDVGEDFSKAESFHRMHAAFERDITSLGKQVEQLQETATKLRAQYAGERADAIQAQERDALEAWKALLDACEGRRKRLLDTAQKFRFFAMVRDLTIWMESIIQQIDTQEKPRDVSSVELLQKYHQGIRSEIEARTVKVTECTDLGAALLAQNHRDSAEIQEKMTQLAEKYQGMMTKWDDRWDWLRLLLEVCQFARDASVAEAWLVAQEPYVNSKDLGQSVDDVEKLLKRHEAFEKSTAAWEERFSALERLTTLELLELRKRQIEIEQFVQEQQRYDQESRREDTGFAESSQLFTQEEETLSGAAEPSSGFPEVTATSERRDSGSLEPSVSLAAEGQRRAVTLPGEAVRAQTVLLEGLLGRKQDVGGSGKKASNRSWNNLYCVLRPGQLSVYKDAKSFGHGTTFHGEDPLQLANATWEPLDNYKRKKHVAKLRLGDGSEYLFNFKDVEELKRWSQAMLRAIQSPAVEEEGAAGSAGAKTHSLPPPVSSSPTTAKREKEKKFGRFAKKK